MTKTHHCLCVGLAALAPCIATAGPFAGTVSNLPVGFSFVEYTNATLLGAGPAVGGGWVDISSTLFYIDERTGPGGKAWYFFFDPAGSQTLGTAANPVFITFNQKITNLWSTHAAMNVAARNTLYGVDLDGDGIPGETKASNFANRRTSDYLTSANIGRESNDSVTRVDDYTLRIRFSASDPGDHFRVTVVPEPEAYGLALAGLGVVAVAMRRRRIAT